MQCLIYLKVNDTPPLFVGNTYHLTAYLTDNNGAKLNGEIISWNPQFKGGNARFSNTVKGMNEVSTDVVFLRANADVWLIEIIRIAICKQKI